MGGHEESDGLFGQEMTVYAEIILSLPVPQAFTYRIPASLRDKVDVGSRALVPFKQRTLTGIIVKIRQRKPKKGFEYRDILGVLDESPVFTPSFLSFTQKLSDLYHSSWGEILQTSLPPSYLLKTETRVSLRDEGKKALDEETLGRAERMVLSTLLKREYSVLFLKRKLKLKNISTLVKRLEEKGFVEIQRTIKREKTGRASKPKAESKQLEIDFSVDRASRHAADTMTQKIGEARFSPFCLQATSDQRGAVYFHFIKMFLEKKKRILFLVPEIVLTETLIERFETRLGRKAACLHSQLPEGKRISEWLRIKRGEVDVVVGPRSALLSPIENLGLIIVDEEQDESYYQSEAPSYDAGKGAWIKAREEGCVLIYGSANPSVETYYRAKRGRYLHTISGQTKKQKVSVLAERKSSRILHPTIRERIAETLENREPVLMFINRRGYASFLYCPRCQYIPRCPRCDISLTYHKRTEKLACHYCDYSQSKMVVCPRCGSKIIFKRGPGIEVVEEELKKNFPQNRIVSFDTDVARKRAAQRKILRDYSRGRIDILIGTQLLAHQANLSPAALVAILYPEITLSLSDYKSSQRAYHDLRHMMSFAWEESAEVFIQTALPHHFTIKAAADDDYASFYKREIKFRRLMNYPPFCTMAEVLFRGDNRKTLAKKSREFYALVKDLTDDVEILGPALASGPRLRGQKGVQFILKAKRRKKLDDVIKNVLRPIKVRKSLWIYE